MALPLQHDLRPSICSPTCTWSRLPSLTDDTSSMSGPTPWSNWVMGRQVLAGAYPAGPSDTETERILHALLECGINSFICLQAEVDFNLAEHLWRAGVGLRPYIHDAERLLTCARKAGHPKITQCKLDFLHLPIMDGGVAADAVLERLAADCCQRVAHGEKLYIHCWGGHGRTGTLVAVMLARLYNLPADVAMRYTQAYHDSRTYPQNVRSPQTAVQRAQVRRLVHRAGLDCAAQESLRPPDAPVPLKPSSKGAAAIHIVADSSRRSTLGAARDKGAVEGTCQPMEASSAQSCMPVMPGVAAVHGSPTLRLRRSLSSSNSSVGSTAAAQQEDNETIPAVRGSRARQPSSGRQAVALHPLPSKAGVAAHPTDMKTITQEESLKLAGKRTQALLRSLWS